MIPHSRPTIGREEKRACLKVLESLQIAQGRKVAEFERRFCRLTGRRYGVAVHSGSTALALALRVLGVGDGDEVILPSYNCAALLHAVEAVDAKPVLVDIEPEDYNFSLSGIRAAAGAKTKAVIAAHLFGRPGRIRELLRLGIPVIEDATQALGARAGGKPAGSFGAVSIFSFYATKMMTTGEGGILLTDSRRLAGRLADLRDYDKKNSHRFRMNAKMTDIQAAIGIEQLKKLPFFIRRRREIAGLFRKALEGAGVGLPPEDACRDHVYSRFVVGVRKRPGEVLRRLRRAGLDAKSPIYKPLHRALRLPAASFPQTARAVREVISVPIYPSMTDRECRKVCAVLRSLDPQRF